MHARSIPSANNNDGKCLHRLLSDCMNSISVYHCCKNTEYCTAQKIYVGGNITVFHGQTWPKKFLHYENFECIPDLLCPTWKYHIMHMQCAPCVFELAKSIQNQSSVCMQSCHFTATFN